MSTVWVLERGVDYEGSEIAVIYTKKPSAKELAIQVEYCRKDWMQLEPDRATACVEKLLNGKFGRYYHDHYLVLTEHKLKVSA